MKSKQNSSFDVQGFLDSSGINRKIVEYRRAAVIFTQGDPCEHVLYLQKGGVKLSVLSKSGREAVVAMLCPGEFFGEGCLAGQPIRIGNAKTTRGLESGVCFVHCRRRASMSSGSTITGERRSRRYASR